MWNDYLGTSNGGPPIIGETQTLLLNGNTYNTDSDLIYNWFSCSTCALPMNVYLDHNMSVYEISESADSYNTIISTIEEMKLLIPLPCTDVDEDDICDDIDDCVGIVDECGICNGSGFPDGTCDCNGTTPDEGENCDGTLMNSNNYPLKSTINSIYPNPFNPSVNINFSLQVSGITNISINDIHGNTIEEISNRFLSTGEHSVKWDGSNVVSGLYFVVISNRNSTISQKIILMK